MNNSLREFPFPIIPVEDLKIGNVFSSGLTYPVFYEVLDIIESCNKCITTINYNHSKKEQTTITHFPGEMVYLLK